MNYSIKNDNTLLLFCINKNVEQQNYKGYFMYSADCGQYISTEITGNNDSSVMEKMFYQAIRDIKSIYGEEIKELASVCLKKFYDSKLQKFNQEHIK